MNDLTELQALFDRYRTQIEIDGTDADAEMRVTQDEGMISVEAWFEGTQWFVLPLGATLETALQKAERLLGIEKRQTGELDAAAGAADDPAVHPA